MHAGWQNVELGPPESPARPLWRGSRAVLETLFSGLGVVGVRVSWCGKLVARALPVADSGAVHVGIRAAEDGEGIFALSARIHFGDTFSFSHYAVFVPHKFISKAFL